MSKITTFVALFVLLTASVAAQTSTGSITGTVRDESGGIIPGASVTAIRGATGETRAVVTEDNGIYRVLNIPPGDYHLRVEMTGFKTATTQDFKVTIGELVRLDVDLSVGDISEEIVVQSQTEVVQKEEGRMSQLVQGAEIQDLPLNGRNAYQLAQLGPGIYPTMGVTAQDSGSNAGSSFITNGQRHRANNFLMDGTDNNYVGIAGVPSVTPQVDMIEEFRVHTNNFSAEFGRNAGAIVNILTKSGTNELHGTMYYYHRNHALHAREFFDGPEPAPLLLHTYGFTVGGPAIKDKLFLFGGFEGFRQTAAESSVFQVESQEMLAWLQQNNPTSIAASLFQRFPLVGGAPSDPNFDPNNIQPVEVSKGTPSKTNQDQWNVRVDWTISDNDRMYVRYTNHEEAFPPTIVRPSVDNVGAVTERAATFSETHVFSPVVVNELRLGWNMRKPDFDVQDGTYDVPTISISGFSPDFGAASNIPQFFSRHTYQISDQLSWSRGNHSFKFGFEFRQGQENSDFQASTRGVYSFDDITEFLNDNPFQQGALINPLTGERIGTPRHFRVNEWAMYVQDDWKLMPNLTVNIGLRYENFRPPWEGDGIQSNIVMGQGADFFERFANSTVEVFPDGSHIYDPDNNNFAPRLGFAWDPRGDGKWAIRGGYGISYNRIFMNITSNIKFNPPFAKSITARDDIIYTIPSSVDPSFVGPASGRFNPNALDKDLATSYVHSIFFGVQREVFGDWLLEANYVSTLGRKLYAQEHYNRFTGDGCDVPGGNCATGNLTGINSGYGVAADDYLTASIQQAYHGGQFSVNKRFTRGLGFRINYTWAKNIDDDSDVFGTTSEDSGSSVIENRKLDRGLSSINVSNRFAANWVWDIPYGRNHDNWAIRNILGGWQVNGLIALQDGSPASINADGSNCNSTTSGVIRGDFNCDGFTNDRPNNNSSLNYESVNPADARLGTSIFLPFSTSSTNARLAFPRPVQGTIGDLGRNTFFFQGFNSVDFSLFKNIQMPWFYGERSTWQFRWEFFNLFNRVNTNPWEESISSGNFGRTFGTRDAREMQIALKFIF